MLTSTGNVAMDSARWQRIRDLFERAVELDSGARGDFLGTACEGDPALQAEVEAMLAADAQAQAADTSIGGAAPDLLADLVARHEREADATRWAGRRMGPWRLEREIGRGGMGAVWLAHRDDGAYEGRVAVKLMRAGVDGGDLARRFLAERQILAGLDHPNIARLIDAGRDADGAPFLALEYVEGEAITAWCDRLRLPVEARLRLFLQVCAAVAHAHQRLVVHRDLKPSNILVNAEGRVRLLDFGIAKLIAQDGAATVTAHAVFTPEYAAPEQVRGELATTAVDVYALGVLLYELLSGRQPYQVDSGSPLGWQRAVLEQEPQRPSAAITRRTARAADPSAAALAGQRGLAPRRLRLQLRGDLDAIVLKALRKDPGARHESVQQLAHDVLAWLEGRPVSARRGSTSYRAWRWMARHALAASLVALAAISLLAGLGAALWQAREARAQRDAAQAQRELAREEAQRAEATVKFLTDVFAQADPGNTEGAALTASEVLAAAEREVARDAQLGPEHRLSLALAVANAYRALSENERMYDVMQQRRADITATTSTRLRVEALMALGVAHARLGRGDEALAHYAQAETANAGGDPLLQARIDRLFAMMHVNRREVPQGMARIERAYRTLLAETGPVSEDFVGALDVYLLLLESADRSHEAVAVTLPSYRALAGTARIPAERRATIQATHAHALLLAGELAEAERVVRESLALGATLYGAQHYNNTSRMSKLVAILRAQGRQAEAAGLADDIVTIRRTALTPHHPMLLFALHTAARQFLLAGQSDRALALVEEARRRYLERDGAGSAPPAGTELLRAEILLARQEPAAAQAIVAALGARADTLSPQSRIELETLRQRIAVPKPP
jgi:eukaryotic-like serine/threonine-protein kinase